MNKRIKYDLLRILLNFSLSLFFCFFFKFKLHAHSTLIQESSICNTLSRISCFGGPEAAAELCSLSGQIAVALMGLSGTRNEEIQANIAN